MARRRCLGRTATRRHQDLSRGAQARAPESTSAIHAEKNRAKQSSHWAALGRVNRLEIPLHSFVALRRNDQTPQDALRSYYEFAAVHVVLFAKLVDVRGPIPEIAG
jgi:hypothetical protein